MHDDIRAWVLKGDLGEANAATVRERLIGHLESMMRDYGYVPSIDNDPQFTREYNHDRDTMEFVLTVYGVQVGKEKAWQVSGMAGGKEIPRYTHLNK